MRKPLVAHTIRLVGLMALLVAGFFTTRPAYALYFDVTFPNGVHQAAIPLRPGESTSMVFSVVNLDYQAGIADPGALFLGDALPQAEYVIDSGTPESCGPPAITPATAENFGTVRFAVGPLDVGESITCTYRVTRAAMSLNDLKLSVCSGRLLDFTCFYIHPAGVYLAGTLPDLALRSAQVGYFPIGAMEGMLRITGTNLSDRDLAEQNIATVCTEFGGGFFGPSPFEIDNDFPGACPSGNYFHFCGNFTGMHFSSKAYLVGPIPANGEASCLLHVRLLHPLTDPVSLEVGYYQYVDFVHFADGGIGFDPNDENSKTNMTVVPGAPYVAVAVLAIGHMGQLAFALLLIACAIWRMRVTLKGGC